jgi:hypothetical protein
LELETNEFVKPNQNLKQNVLQKFKRSFSNPILILSRFLFCGKVFVLASVRAQGGGRGKLSLKVSYARWVGLSDVRLSMGTTRQGACGVA